MTRNVKAFLVFLWIALGIMGTITLFRIPVHDTRFAILVMGLIAWSIASLQILKGE